MKPAWMDRYLGMLEVRVQTADLTTLQRLTRAHLSRVPFENVSSILRRGATLREGVAALDPRVLLDNWVEGRAGGVCFEITEMFGLLLRDLGYHAYPVLAQISFPGSHQALVVQLAGARYLVDVGNGAPFFEPVPLEGTLEVHTAGLAYQFRPDPLQPESWWQDRQIDGKWAPFAQIDLRPSGKAERETAFQLHHTRGHSWVVDELRMVSCTPDEVCVVREGQLTRFRADQKCVEPLEDRLAYRRMAAEDFGLPNLPVTAALDVLDRARSRMSS